jgi:hypothetical protein
MQLYDFSCPYCPAHADEQYDVTSLAAHIEDTHDHRSRTVVRTMPFSGLGLAWSHQQGWCQI